jgi:hypothetical protein
LTSFDLSSNQIDSFGIAAISQFCERNRALRHQKRLIPRKGEFIRLTIDKVKLPLVEGRMSEVISQAEELADQNDKVQDKIENVESTSEIDLA